MLISWPMGSDILGFVGTVSKNMLMSDFGEVPESLLFRFFGGLSRRICSFRGLWALVFSVFWDCLESCGDSSC